MEFRKDINGLRALAVIAVMLFHFNEQLLPGGFAGVDVFFVISGFLMTSIIFKGLDRSEFSLLKFYWARFRRIVPALTVLCLALLIFGWLSLSPLEYQKLSAHALSSLAFGSNVIYWLSSGYFDASSYQKWLLHTWSLSVEWQFYLIYPVLLLASYRLFGNRLTKILLVAAALLGLLLSMYLSSQSPSAAFFLLPTRCWQMILGGLVFLFPLSLSPSLRRVLEVVGISLILLAYVVVSGTDIWPGYLSLIPVMGAVLVIAANHPKSLLDNRLCQTLGSASYSLYLWHWPFAVWLYNARVTDEWGSLAIGLTVSVVAGFASFYLVENNAKKARFWPLFGFWLLVCVIAVGIYVSRGAEFHWRQAAVSEQALYEKKYHRNQYLNDALRNEYWDQCNFYDGKLGLAKAEIDQGCTGPQARPSLFLWGDSHAQALSHGLRYYSQNHDVAFYQVASSACAAALSNPAKGAIIEQACAKSNQFALESIRKIKPDIVLLVQRDQHDQTDWQALSQQLLTAGVKQVMLIGPMPQWQPSLPLAIIKRHWHETAAAFEDPALNQNLLKIDSQMRQVLPASGPFQYISLIEGLCQGQVCLAKLDAERTPLVWDYGHLTLEGSRYVVEQIIGPKLDDWFAKHLALPSQSSAPVQP